MSEKPLLGSGKRYERLLEKEAFENNLLLAAEARSPAPSPSPVVEVSEETTFTSRITANVTEEMVEAAMVKWRGSQWGRHPFLSQTETEAKDFEAMRAALVAALSAS